jgi:hypothetical protein
MYVSSAETSATSTGGVSGRFLTGFWPNGRTAGSGRTVPYVRSIGVAAAGVGPAESDGSPSMMRSLAVWRIGLCTRSPYPFCRITVAAPHMTKYFNAKVQLIQTKTVLVQVAADNEADAIELAKAQARSRAPEFTAHGVSLTLVGESELGVGSRVVHKTFGPGVIEQLHPDGLQNSFRMQIKFDRGDTKHIHGPGAFIRPEGMGIPE